jgi:hypothetical protein
LFALATAAGSAFAAQVKGRIDGQQKLIPDVYLEAAKPEAHRYTWREPSPTVRQDFRVLSGNPSRELCIAALSGTNAPPHEPILIKITGGRTIPSTIVVSPGTHLAFENRDPFPHRLYIPGSPTWKAELINPAQRREWTAPNGAAKFEFRDELFPSVRSYVVVEPAVIEIAYPGRDGAFFMNLSAGDYTLKAFFNGRQVGKALAVTAKEKATVEIKEALLVGEGADAK